MTNKEKAAKIAEILEQKYPDAECSLDAKSDPWRLLVMARLSAQCTDERVNEVSHGLFERFPDAESMANAPLEEIEDSIRSCGLYRMKAKNLKDSARMLLDRFGGEVPGTMDELLSLPGVGRKIANLILGDVFGKGGIVADTHCIRICGRLGFYDSAKKDPILTERVMSSLLPSELQSDFCHRIVMFGRETCTARDPKCEKCEICSLCTRNLQNNT